MFTVFGVPLSILTDRGQSFVGDLISELSRLCKVKRLRTSAYHPATNAQCERFNSTLWTALKTYCTDQNCWDEYLPSILAAYRATPSIYSTHYSPFYVLYGREMRLPLDLDLIPKPTKSKNIDAYIEKMVEKLKVVRDIAKQNIEHHNKLSKSQYDKNARPANFEIGDKVLLYNPKVPTHHSPKLWNKYYRGPYYICEKVGDTNYFVRDAKTQARINHPVHANRLKLFVDGEELRSEPVGDNRATLTPPDLPAGQTSDSLNSDLNSNLDRSSSADAPVNMEVVRKLAGVKHVNGTRYYKVIWDSDGLSTWVPANELSDYLKQEYHITRTLKGKRRRRRLRQ